MTGQAEMFQLDQMQPGARRIVIVGCGGLGAGVATSLSEQGHSIHILDTNDAAFGRLPQAERDSGQIVPYIGDGTVYQDLLRASAQDADVFMALSDVDTTNALSAQIGRHVYQIPTVICRIDDSTLQEMYNELGLTAISATTLATQVVLRVTTE